MSNTGWQLHSPLDAIVFDCDGTLSRLEGINVLAEQNGVGERITELTQIAMGQTGIDVKLYEQRLSLVRPSHQQVVDLGLQYFSTRSPDGMAIIEIFKRLGKAIYLISAGVNPAVQIFGQLMGIPLENILAVDLQFDRQGQFVDFDHHSPFATYNGKRRVIANIKNKHPRVMMVGDGMNDVVTIEVVDRFVGYGGAFYRDRIQNISPFYIKTASLLPLLPLGLTIEEADELPESERLQYNKAVDLIDNDGLVINLELNG